ncbi:MAG TPA: lysophospholipid acyltransferase family protein [Dissulfurispiraceae bacterium]|nr:lysophospholipid acyltransferase family protein [Dissulfurispiraceae bacterium]
MNSVTPLKIYRILLLIVASLMFLLIAIGLNVIFAFSRRRKARAAATGAMLWAKTMCRIFGVRVVTNLPPAEGGVFTVCNHISYLDIFVLGSLRPSSFLSKHEVRGWPLIGLLASLGGTVFVNRESKRTAVDSIKKIRQKIEEGIAVIIFPEGTTSNGKRIMPFKSAFFKVPASMNIPVAPASIRYAPEISDKVAWYGDMELAPHFWQIIGVRRIDAVLHFGPPVSVPDGASQVQERKLLCSQVYEYVVEGFNACGTMKR